MSKNNESEVGNGSKRAQDFADAMKGVPGYSDNSMFTVMQYGAKAQVRACASRGLLAFVLWAI